MPFSITYVRRFAEVVDSAADFLSRPVHDLFARPRIVVPHAGAKAWLHDRLARTLGTSRHGREDGIVANVDISFPGTITSLLQPPPDAKKNDPWSFDRLTFALLDVITGPASAALGIPFDVHGEPLLAARRIAALFDTYHAHRPGMINRWESGQPVLNPVATGSRSIEGEWAADALAVSDAWQFRTWRAVRQAIGTNSPPARMIANVSPRHEPLLVLGLQSLSLRQITCLRKLSETSDVSVVVVHPSPPLRVRWAAAPPPVSIDVPPPRETPDLPEDLDPLVTTWLHGARETQILLASQGIHPEHAAPTGDVADAPNAPLLSRLRRSIATAAKPVPRPHDTAKDPSVTIHRCHTLSRQAEVLHDAILHAFRDLENLQPHEVVIVSPCLDRLAPHLEAVFDREITCSDHTPLKLPLVVADRGLHEVSDAAGLLIAVMQLVGSRCSVEQFRAIAVHPLVQKHFGVNDEMVRCWDTLVERSGIHWGFDAAHRERENFPASATTPHTWQAGLERMLLGAVMPARDSEPDVLASEISGVHPETVASLTIPLEDVPLASLPAIETLVRIFEVVSGLDDACCGQPSTRATAEWCGLVERTLFGLCGPETADLAEPLRAIRRLSEAASTTPVPFHDVRTVLEESLTSAVGRQPLRTGKITATSMVPLRDVPFRVICVTGYDDGVIGTADLQGDNLMARQSLAGDGDPRIDARRAFLDCMLAAEERLIVTCNGMNIKNNKSLPLVTPLAEFVDFAVRHGVHRPDAGGPSAIEIEHPRHAVGRRNFQEGAVQPGLTWSHDAAALAASQAMGREERVAPSGSRLPPDLPVVELSSLEDMVRDPLRLYLTKTLGIETWRDDEEFPPATFPLAIPPWETEKLAREFLDLLVSVEGDRERRIQDWIIGIRAAGRVPFGEFGQAVIEEVRQLAGGLASEAAAEDPPIPLLGFESIPVRIPLPSRILTGTLPHFHRSSNQFVDVRVTEGDRAARGMPLHIAALRLLIAHAANLSPQPPERTVVVARHEKWKVDGDHKAMIARTILLADPLRDPGAATARLAEICDLLPLALASPRGRFRHAASATVRDPVKGRSEFQRCVAGPHFHLSREAMVYGPTPRFDDVFGPSSPERAFHAEFERLFTIKTVKKAYVLS